MKIGMAQGDLAQVLIWNTKKNREHAFQIQWFLTLLKATDYFHDTFDLSSYTFTFMQALSFSLEKKVKLNLPFKIEMILMYKTWMQVDFVPPCMNTATLIKLMMNN